MKSLEKFLKSQTFFIILALVVLVIAFNCYSNNKSSVMSGFTTLQPQEQTSNNATKPSSSVQGIINSSESGSPISGISTPNVQGGNCASKTISNPADLLPKDTNSEWAKLNPHGTGGLENISLLKSGHHIGINTVSSSLRNANLQVRSEPQIPKSNVGPWLNSTIEPDCGRKQLEIGTSVC